ncbi:MAG: GntR family transcriptional regulator [Bryobacteraceae bacterium]
MKPISPVTRVDQVRHAILELIFSGALRPGERLVEAYVAAQLGVSQATVNSALQVLDDQGIVCKVLNRSTNVCRYTAREIDNLFSVRLILEPAAAEAASRIFSAEGRSALQKQVDAMRQAAHAQDLPHFCLADYTFHQELYRITGNPVLTQACQAIAAAPFAYILCDCTSALPTDYVQLAEDHQEVILALEQSPEAAAEITRDRINAWRMHSARALESIAADREAYA